MPHVLSVVLGGGRDLPGFLNMLAFCRQFALAAASTLALCAAPSICAAMNVRPVILDLSNGGRSMSTVVSVENPSDRGVPVELTVHEAEPTPEGLVPTTTPSDDLLVFPPQALIEPGKTQAFRVQFVGDPDMTKSKHYFVTVAQLPVQLPGGSNAIQILYNFQVAVSVGVSGERSEITLTDSKIVKNEVGEFQPVLTFSNTGKTYGYVSEGGLRLTVKDAAGKEVFSKRYDSSDIEQDLGFGLVAADGTRQIILPVDVKGEGVVEASFAPPRRR